MLCGATGLFQSGWNCAVIAAAPIKPAARTRVHRCTNRSWSRYRTRVRIMNLSLLSGVLWKRMRFFAAFLALAISAATPALAQLTAEQKQLNVASFERVW